MDMQGRVRVGFAFALVVLVQPVLAHAVVVVPGPNTIPIGGTTVALRPELAGVVLEDVMRPFQQFDQFGALIATGNIQEQVYQSNLTGKLIFDASIHIDWVAPGVVWSGFERERLGGFQTDVDWRIDGLGTLLPTGVWRPSPGNVVVFNAFLAAQAGDQTRFMFVATDAPYYAESADVLRPDFFFQNVNYETTRTPGFYPVFETPNPACSDKVDDDHDGLVDYPNDPGCTSPSDTSEDDASLPCDDGVDNDGDGHIDFRVDGQGDPGCYNATAYSLESPACQDGIDNDADTGIDFDGGAAANGGVALGPPDPQCPKPYRNNERPASCGLGAEVAFALPALMAMARRNARRRAASE